MTLLLLGSTSAHAADELGLSRDGVTWASELPGGLFDDAFRWVPGDSETESFYVRNQGPSDSVMVIEARSADSDELLSNDDIELRVRVDGGTWVDLQNGEPSKSLSQQSIGEDDVVHVDVNATFDPASTNQSQSKTLDLTFTVALADSLQGDGGDSGDDLLPGTGAQVSSWLVIAAGVMLTLGVRLVRRRESRHD
ncbi:LPXTG cell wall anchor domain-containing protein [Aeromicrobium sp.]|uniref:LPXTG cell wall anchor domain-containing protein n=1 Tax=Aeromicrobium sp. TaxID=1871063 RepID=UPI002FC887F3